MFIIIIERVCKVPKVFLCVEPLLVRFNRYSRERLFSTEIQVFIPSSILVKINM